MARIAKTASALDFLRRDQKLVALAGADHELPLPARSDLAGKRVLEMAMAQAVDDQRLDALQGLARLAFPLRRLGRPAKCSQPLWRSPFISLIAAAKACGLTVAVSP